MAYATAAMVRELASAITTTVISDANILVVSGNHADPIIDAALSGMGAPYTTAPTLIKHIASLFTAARIFDDKFYQTGDYSKWAQKARREAWNLIKRIRAGELTPGGEVTTAPLLTAVDPSDDRSEYEVFINEGDKELDWEWRDESRE